MHDLARAPLEWNGEDRRSERNLELAKQVNVGLHELSQPLTALLCALEHGATLDSLDELKIVVRTSLEQCERLGRTVNAMQLQIQQTLHREGPTVWT